MNRTSVIHKIVRIGKLGSYAFLLSMLGSTIGGFINYLFAYILGQVTAISVQQASTLTFDFAQFSTLILYFIGAFPLLLSGQMMTLVGGLKAANNLRTQVIAKTLSHDERSIKDSHTGDLMARLTSDASIIDDFYFQGLNYRVINPLVSGTASLITIFTLSIPLGFISIGFGIVTYFVTSQFAPRIQKSAEHARHFSSTSTKVMSEILSNEEFVRLANIKDRIIKKYTRENQHLKEASIKTATDTQSAESLNETIAFVTRLSYLIICAYLALNGHFNFASILLLIRLQPNVSNAFGNLSASWNYFVEVSVSANRILEVIDTPQEDSRSDKPTLSLDTPPTIDFKNITFSYSENQALFNNLNLSIKENQTIAFVGESGSGKSSLFQLLLGFYNPSSGSITLNNQSLSDYTLDSCRNHMIYIQQESPLFNRSIYENIALGSRKPLHEISDDAVYEAAKAANIHDFILTLPQGYDTKVGENANMISGGQKQRIAIARAFMSDAPLLIMDEPTSALDAESETLIQESLKRLKSHKTVLIAAHRLSTIKEADMIIVLENGRISEEGTHDQLLHARGTYYRYALLQSESH